MMYKGLMVLVWLWVLSAGGVVAQEKLAPLMVNPVIIHQKTPKDHFTKVTLQLPFREDFSNGMWYPDPQRWSDDDVFVNHDYPIGAPTIGVATFDALDARGAVYDVATSFPFPADTLTSHEIDLSAVKQSDSVYFSFHYQPAGIGNAPEGDDSLLLEFWSEKMQQWIHVWADGGQTYEQFLAQHGTPFLMVLLPVDSLQFFSDKFRFRFRNYASITDASLPDWGGNVDQWHVDYIVLDMNRGVQDNIIRDDIAFRKYPASLLKNYVSMPWNQYLANAVAEMRYDVSIPYSCYYHNIASPVNQVYHVNSLTGGTSYTPSAYNFGNMVMPVDTVVKPTPSSNFNSFVFSSPSLPYADFELLAWISAFSVNETIGTNDTVRFYQRFYNYYAYDDGTPEAGYGLASSNPNATLQAALGFSLNVPDTLRSVQIFFNQTKDLANDEFFNLKVWNSGPAGGPGDTLITLEDLKPVFVEGLNQYYTYILPRPVPVSGTFYVGWEQNHGTMLHVGFDRNHDSREHLFYNIGTGWDTSQFKGALMIRPVLGDTTGVYIAVPEESGEVVLEIYPNPASDRMTLKMERNDLSIRDIDPITTFYNMMGQKVKEIRGTGDFDVSDLREGFYVLQVTESFTGRLLHSSKLVIRR